MITSRVNWPPPGRYLLAISGGADSMALLDLMASAQSMRRYELEVAHFDHGMRPDSHIDQDFVAVASARYGLPYESQSANLSGVSEAAARDARYQWLGGVALRLGGLKVVTAHHQDDLIETSLLNLARGTGRRGLAPMQNGPILRPLLGLSRSDLRAFANDRKLVWREDKSNADLSNPRNYIRHILLASSDVSWRNSYLGLIVKVVGLNTLIAQHVGDLLSSCLADDGSYSFPRSLVQALSITEVEELIVAACLALDPSVELDRRIVSEIGLFAKTGRPGTARPLRGHLLTGVQTDNVRVYYMGIQGRR